MNATVEDQETACAGASAGMLPTFKADYPLPDFAALGRALDDGDIPHAFGLIRSVCLLPEMCAQLCPGLSVSLREDAAGEEGRVLRDVYRELGEAARRDAITGASMPPMAAGKMIAVIGGGPAGLACSVSLIERGHEVNLFEKSQELGGVPRQLIRASRYAGDIEEIDALIAPALGAGRLQVALGRSLGDDLALDALTQNYDAVVLAAGVWQEESLGRHASVIGGVTFLSDAKAGRRVSVPARVAILAGGDSAMDAAVVAQELGAREITVLFRDKLSESHWHLPESWFASSGAQCLDSARVVDYVETDTGALDGLRIERDGVCAADLLAVDLVIEAMHLRVDDALRTHCQKILFRRDGLLRPGGSDTYATSLHGVFAAGAILNGGATVGRCVSEGMKAAEEIDQFLEKGKSAKRIPAGKTRGGLRLQSCRKLQCGRCVTPEETIARLESVIGDRHAYGLVEESLSEHLHWTALFVDDLDFFSMGKGTLPILSKAGALAECAEWLSSLDTTELPGFTIAHQDELSDCLPVEDLLSHVDSVNAELLHEIKELDCAHYWVDGYSLRDEKHLKVPIDYIRQINAPNGLASGNQIEEAIVHASNEIFERRALITVLRNRMVVPTIDPDSIENEVIQAQLAFVRNKGIEVTLKDLTFGGMLPCVGAYFFDPHIPETHQFRHFFKAGSSFNVEDALIRTFTEYTQGRRLDEFISDDPEAQARVLEHDFRRLRCIPDDGDNFLSTFLFGFVPFPSGDFLREGDPVPLPARAGYSDCLEDIEACKSICRHLDKDYIVVDCTDPDIGFPVAQVIIPGYSDILPYHPALSRVLFKPWTREAAIASYQA